MTYYVIAEFESMAFVETALEALEKSGYTRDDVTLISSAKDVVLRNGDADGTIETKRSETQIQAPSSESIGLGLLLGGTMAAPLAVTPIGPLFVVGPLLGMGIGGVAGALVGINKLSGTDPATQAYRDKVLGGSRLVIVHDEDPIRVRLASAVLKTCGPLSVQDYE